VAVAAEKGGEGAEALRAKEGELKRVAAKADKAAAELEEFQK
jgi:hypothetical protein